MANALLGIEGLDVERLEPKLARAIGDVPNQEGARVLARTIQFFRARVRQRDWLYCLVSEPDSLARQVLIESFGKQVNEFVDVIEAGFEPDNETDQPARLTSETVEPEVVELLDRAEAVAGEHVKGGSPAQISEAALILAMLETSDDGLRDMLEAWATSDGIETLRRRALGRLRYKAVPNILGSDSRIDRSLFHFTGLRLLDRVTEDAKSLRVRRVSARHLLYSMLGYAASPLRQALELRASLDVSRDLHGTLSRELSRPGKGRLDSFTLSGETMLRAVALTLQAAMKNAIDRGSDLVTDGDVAVAFLEKHAYELHRLLDVNRPLDVDATREYIAQMEPEEQDAETSGQRLSVDEVRARILDRIVGQEHAVHRVIPWVKRLRFGLPRDGRPAAVLLFLGPTGTGKTQLAKELARYVFGSSDEMIFIEMGQFQTKESMSGLIGAPPGYVGYGEGILTNGLAEKAEAVVLFDEIEKAATTVFDVLLRFADEGVISDPAGPVRDGSKCIIVMTTNAGQAWLREHLARTPAAREDPETLSRQLFEEAMLELRRRDFRPEFLGRVDERITFLPFDEHSCRQIVDRVLDAEIDRLRDMKTVTLSVSDEARQHLAREAHERSLDEGARGAPRAVNNRIVTPTIDLLTQTDRPIAGTAVVANKHGNEIVIEVL